METLWFCLLAFLFVGYVLLDGYDLGAGTVHLFVSRTENEKRQTLAAIQPFWDANEVWLLTAGGTLFFAFPRLYASSFGGFYLPLMMVLWLLILRGLSIEFRNHLAHPVWTPVWDAGFAVSSAVLSLFFGVALGNVIRGVPLDQNGEFFVPLWTHFSVQGEAGVLDWYTVPVGLFAVAALALHGTLWLNFRVLGPLKAKVRRAAAWLWPAVLILAIAITVLTFQVQPQARIRLSAAPWGAVFPVAAAVGLGGAWLFLRQGKDLAAFTASSMFLLGMLGSAAFTIYPYVLPANTNREFGLTIYNSNPGHSGLMIGLWWWIPGMLLATAYTFFTHRHFSDKVPERPETTH